MDEPAREHDVRHVPGSFVRLERTEDPRGESTKDPGRLVKVEQDEAHPVDVAGNGLLDAVVDEQPTVFRSDRRWADADPERVPPGAVAGLEHLLG
jgi:hypothetical protein